MGLVFTFFMLVLYLFSVVQSATTIPWVIIDLVFNCIWALLHLIASILVIKHSIAAFIAAAVFGFMATAAYIIGAGLLSRSCKIGTAPRVEP